MTPRTRRRAGYTLIELVATFVVMAVLAAAGVAGYRTITTRFRDEADRSFMYDLLRSATALANGSPDGHTLATLGTAVGDVDVDDGPLSVIADRSPDQPGWSSRWGEVSVWASADGTVAGTATISHTGKCLFGRVEVGTTADVWLVDADLGANCRGSAPRAGGDRPPYQDPATVGRPDPPADLAVTEGDGTLTLIWVPSPSGDVNRYRIWVDGSEVATVTGTSRHTVNGLTNGRRYIVEVAAVDDEDLTSSRRDSAGTPRDLTPPDTPTVTVTNLDGRVQLAWAPLVDPDGGGGASGIATVTATGADSGTLADLDADSTGFVWRRDGANEQPAPVTITVTDQAGNQTMWTGTTRPTDQTGPPAPGAPQATSAYRASQITWTTVTDIDPEGWAGGPSGVERYRVELSEHGGPWVVADSSPGSTVLVVGLQDDTTYDARVVAVDRNGNESDPSATVSFTTLTYPGVPQVDVTATTTSATATWQPISGADRYEWRLDGTDQTPVTTTTTSFPVQAGGAYTVEVRACHTELCSMWSAPVTVQVAPDVPTLTATASATTLDLAWTATSGATSYEWRTGAGTATATTATAATTTAPAAAAVAAEVRACTWNPDATNPHVCSDWAQDTAVTAPTVTVTYPGTSSTITWTWTAASGPVTRIDVTVRNGATTLTSTSLAASATSYTTNAPAGSTRTIDVTVCAGTDCSSPASASGVTVPGAPSVGTAYTGDDDTPSSGSATSIPWSWPAVTGATSYDWSLYDNATYVTGGTTTSTSVSATGLSAGSTRNVRVAACNAAGCSATTTTSGITRPATPAAPTASYSNHQTAFYPDWPNVASATGYWTHVRHQGGGTATKKSSGSSSSWTGQAAGNWWDTKVSACNTAGCSAYSATTRIWTAPPDPTVSGSAYLWSQTITFSATGASSYGIAWLDGAGVHPRTTQTATSKTLGSDRLGTNWADVDACNVAGCSGTRRRTWDGAPPPSSISWVGPTECTTAPEFCLYSFSARSAGHYLVKLRANVPVTMYCRTSNHQENGQCFGGPEPAPGGSSGWASRTLPVGTYVVQVNSTDYPASGTTSAWSATVWFSGGPSAVSVLGFGAGNIVWCAQPYTQGVPPPDPTTCPAHWP